MNTYDMNVLYEAFLKSMKGSSWKAEPQKFEADFLCQIASLSKELEERTYKTLQGSEFVINERGKTRYIHGGRMRDRVVRHALCDEILSPALKPYIIYNNGASQTGKGISFQRNMFEKDLRSYFMENRSNEGYVALIDLSKFYDNIQHSKIEELIYPKLDNHSAWLLSEIVATFKIDVSYMSDDEYRTCIDKKFNSIEYHSNISKEQQTGQKYMRKSVDIGDQVSQDIGIYFPTVLDNYAKIVRGMKRYGRYMDDIYMIHSSKEHLQDVIEGIETVARKYGMFINKKKTRIVPISKTFKYLQIKYFVTDTGKVVKRINPQSLTRFRRRLKGYKRLLEKGTLTQEDIDQCARSWLGTYYKIMSKRQLKNIKRLYKELFGKEIRWKK